MGVIGGAGGYATLNPTQGNAVGEAMQNVENSAFKYRAEQREEEQNKARKEKAQKEALDAQAKDQLDYASKHKIIPTTIDSVNKSSLDFVLGNKTAYSKFKGILNSSSSNPEEIAKAMEGISNLDNAYEAYKSMPDMLNASAKDLEEGVRAGKYNPNSSIEASKTIEAMSNGSMKVVFGGDGIPKIITYKRDSKGNLTDVIDKEITTEQLKLKLSPVMAFDSDQNSQEFKKSLGDKVKNDVGNKIIESYPGLVEAAEKNANSVVSNRDKMYGVAPDAGVKPKFDLSDYTPEEIEKVKNYVKESLTEKYKESVTDNDAKLSRMQQAENQRRIQANADREFNYKVNKDNQENEEDTTSFSRHIVNKTMELGKSGYKAPAGSGLLMISSDGYKDKSGATRILQEAIRTPNGKYYFGVNERKVNMAKLTPEAEAKKNEAGFDKTDANNYQFSEKVNYYDVDTQSDKVALAILNTKNPETGKKFKNITEAKSFVKNNTKTTTSGAAKAKAESQYSATQENAIKTAMKSNPGYSREEIISALKLK